jgi:hypothetical protein
MRTGETRTTSFSLDDTTRSNLKALASRRHGGNVSALISELAAREVKLAAAEAFFEKYGIPPLSDAAVARIESEWQSAPRQKPLKSKGRGKRR